MLDHSDQSVMSSSDLSSERADSTPLLHIGLKDQILLEMHTSNKLVLKLIDKNNEIVVREELAESDYDESELRKVDVQVTRLRQKIEENPTQPRFIKTIRGKGYKLICNEK